MVNNEQRTMDVIDKMNYSEVVKEYMDICKLEDFNEKTAIPIGFNNITEVFPYRVILSEEIKVYIETFVKNKTNSGFESVEVPFFLVGKYEFLDDDLYIKLTKPIDGNNNLSSKVAFYSSEACNKVTNEIKDNMYNVVVIGHSHPDGNAIKEDSKADKESKDSAIRSYSEQVKEKNRLRELGLNVSLQDIYQAVTFTSSVNRTFKSILTMSCIYHYNGELNFMYYDGEDISLVTDIYYELDNGDIEKISNYHSTEMAKNEKDRRII